MLSTSAPEMEDNVPLLSHSARHRSQNYGALQESLVTRNSRSGRAAKSDNSKKVTTSRLIRASASTPLPTTLSHRPPTRSFLVPSGQRNSSYGQPHAGGVKASQTMSPMPKHQRTSKTSQKLVVLPSAVQTQPMAKQLVLLDAEQEVSDDEAHPHGILPSQAKRPPPQRKRSAPKAPVPRAKVPIEEDDRFSPPPLDDGPPSKLRIRDYKSNAERMSKAERKKAGYKRITAYCVGEGLKMQVLAGFLKREHNVLPRIFDEALYAVSAPPSSRGVILTLGQDVSLAPSSGLWATDKCSVERPSSSPG